MPGSVNQYCTCSPTPFGMFTKTTTPWVGSFSNPPKQNCVGGLIQDRVWQAEVGYRYGFNGMEKDDEVKGEGKSIEFQYRIYDTNLARFLSVDPIASQLPWNSPYSYAENSPSAFIDFEDLKKAIEERKNSPSKCTGSSERGLTPTY